MMDRVLPVLFWVLLLFMLIATLRFIFTALDSPELATETDAHHSDFARCKDLYSFGVWIGLGGVFFLGLDAVFYRVARWLGVVLPHGWREGSMLFAFTLSFLVVFLVIGQLNEVRATLARLNRAEAEASMFRANIQKLAEELADVEGASLPELKARFAACKIELDASAYKLGEADRQLVGDVFKLMRRGVADREGVAFRGG
jgi:hypothetical protein